MKSLVSTMRRSMCSAGQKWPAQLARAFAPSSEGSKHHWARTLAVVSSSRPYSLTPCISGLNQGSNTVTPSSRRNSLTRLRQPNFFSASRDATKSIGPERYTRASRSRFGVPNLPIDVPPLLLIPAIRSHAAVTRGGIADLRNLFERLAKTRHRAQPGLVARGGSEPLTSALDRPQHRDSALRLSRWANGPTKRPNRWSQRKGRRQVIAG